METVYLMNGFVDVTPWIMSRRKPPFYNPRFDNIKPYVVSNRPRTLIGA